MVCYSLGRFEMPCYVAHFFRQNIHYEITLPKYGFRVQIFSSIEMLKQFGVTFLFPSFFLALLVLLMVVHSLGKCPLESTFSREIVSQT